MKDSNFYCLHNQIFSYGTSKVELHDCILLILFIHAQGRTNKNVHV